MSYCSQLEQWASDIGTAVATMAAYARAVGLAADTHTREVCIPPEAPHYVHAARNIVLDATTKMQREVIEPEEYLQTLAIDSQYLACLRWLCHFHVLSCIPLDGSVLYSEIAQISLVPEAQLRRIARMMMTSNFLCEPKPGELAHTTLSASFVTNPALCDSTMFLTSVVKPAMDKCVEATEQFGPTTEKTQTALNIAVNTSLPFGDYVAQTPKLQRQCSAYMRTVTTNAEICGDQLAEAFDWDNMRDATVVDIDTPDYSTAIALATRFPLLRVVVQAAPDVLVSSRTNLFDAPEAVRSRISSYSHNIYAPQLVKGDVFLVRRIAHDVPAAEASAILRSQLAPLKASPRARAILTVPVLPLASEDVESHHEALLRMRDLTWMQVLQSEEREVQDVEDLLAQASDCDGRFMVQSRTKLPGSIISAFETVYQRTGMNGLENSLLPIARGQNGVPQ